MAGDPGFDVGHHHGALSRTLNKTGRALVIRDTTKANRWGVRNTVSSVIAVMFLALGLRAWGLQHQSLSMDA